MRTLLVTAGTRGDVQPMLLLGMRLVERGHGVSFAAQASHRASAARAGLDFVELEGEAIELLHSERGRELVAGSGAREGLEVWSAELRRVAGSWWSTLRRPAAEADVVVSGLLACVVPSEAAAAAGRAHAIMLPFPFEPAWLSLSERLFNRIVERTFLEPLRDWLQQRRRERGLRMEQPSMLRELRAGGALVLRTWSPSICPPPSRSDGEDAIGAFVPSVEDAALVGLSGLSEETERWLSMGDPPLFVGFGSMPFPSDRGLCDALVKTLDATGLRAVVQGPWPALQERLGDERVHRLGPCDHRALLPRCGAAIHHAGAGTTHAVLAAGLPSVACPVVSDQFVWARRIAELGAGVALPARRAMEPALPRAVEKILEPETRRRARELAAALAGEDGLPLAVSRIEGMVS